MQQRPVLKDCIHRRMQLRLDISRLGGFELDFVGVQCVSAGGRGREMAPVSSALLFLEKSASGPCPSRTCSEINKHISLQCTPGGIETGASTL